MKLASTALLAILIFVFTDASAQRWKRDREHFFFSLGATSFLGDLGGADNIGKNGPQDLDLAATRPTFIAGFRYKIFADVAVRGNVAFGYISGNDNHTQEVFRNNRNIHFRSPLTELSVQGEYYFFSTQREGARYRRITRSRSNIGYNFNSYVFLGVGGFFFNPQSYFDAERYTGSVAPADLPASGWYSLRPLKTEGQGYFETRPNYSRLQMTFPLGVGFSFGLTDQIWVGMEIGYRTTFTDYLDDVSTTYVDPAVFSIIHNGDPKSIALAEYFANPTLNNLGTNVTAPGQQRGNPNNTDSYVFTSITMHYKMPTARRPYGTRRFR